MQHIEQAHLLNVALIRPLAQINPPDILLDLALLTSDGAVHSERKLQARAYSSIEQH